MSGTGMLVSSNLVLTNNHVVSQKFKFNVAFNDGTNFNESVQISRSTYYDMAILKLNGNAPNKFSPIKLAEKRIDFSESGFYVGHPSRVWWQLGGWQVLGITGIGRDKER